MTRPTTIQELIDAPDGAAIFDAHDGTPKFITDVATITETEITATLYDHLIKTVTTDDSMRYNKIAYKLDSSDEIICLLCRYDDRNHLLTIEL